MSNQQSSEADARSLTEKLASFSMSLTPGEQAALWQMLQRGASEENEVQGYSSWNPGDANWWWSWGAWDSQD